MPLQLVNQGKGGGENKSLPSFFFEGRNKQITQLKKFLKIVEEKATEYETENEESGWKYVDDNRDKANLNTLLDYGSTKTLALVELAREEGYTPKEIVDLLFKASYIEPSSGEGGENYLMNVPVENELEVDLRQFQGRINKQTYKSVYDGLIEGLDEAQIEKAQSAYEIEDGVMVIDLMATYWSVFVDEEKLMDEFTKKLDMEETEIVERKPAAASLQYKIKETLKNVGVRVKGNRIHKNDVKSFLNRTFS